MQPESEQRNIFGRVVTPNHWNSISTCSMSTVASLRKF